MTAAEWMPRAECREHDPDLFYPIGSGPLAQAQTREAQAVCAICPVKTPCLERALDLGVEHGIWAGHEGDELRRMRSARRARDQRARRQAAAR